MKPDPYHIAQLISKYLRDAITPEEEGVLKRWVSASEANKRLFDRLTDEKQSQDSIAFFETIDVDDAWMRMQGNGKKSSHWAKFFRKAGYAVALVLLFGAVGLWWSGSDLLIGKKHSIDVAKYDRDDVLPGGKKAILLLSDGRKIDLTDGPKQVNEQDGTTIAGENGALKYSSAEQTENKVLYNVLEVPKAGMFDLTLSDGTRVWVNAMSELRFPVHFGKKERRVFLKGEAYFEVAHDAERPFHVEVDGNMIEVLGTNFNVNAYGDGVSTTLVEGAVRVYNALDEKILAPGQEAIVHEDIVIQPANIEKALAWKHGDFYFKRDNIEDIMGQLSRWYDVEVVFKGEYDTRNGYSGAIRRDVKLSEVLEMLSYVSKANFAIEGNTVVVEYRSPYDIESN